MDRCVWPSPGELQARAQLIKKTSIDRPMHSMIGSAEELINRNFLWDDRPHRITDGLINLLNWKRALISSFLKSREKCEDLLPPGAVRGFDGISTSVYKKFTSQIRP
jgi:hypothetical protein